MPRLLMAYDADCGPCTRFRHFIHVIDRKGDVGFISLIDADDSGLLDKIPESERHTAFHVIFSDGELLTGAEAVPPLVELLPAGRLISRAMTAVPGGTHLISVVYAGFARGHNGSSCRYPRPVVSHRPRRTDWVPPGPPSPSPTRTGYVVTGLTGGFLGSWAMGLVVHLPDALCVRLATAIAPGGPGTQVLAWGFHIGTAALIGSTFGVLAAVLRIRRPRSLGRSLVLGLGTGVAVWAGIFAPLMLTFLPWLVNRALLESSLVAHILLGLVLGLTLAMMLRMRGGRDRPLERIL